MANVTATDPTKQLAHVLTEYAALIQFQPTVKRMVVDSLPLAHLIAQKMDVILSTESVATYVQAYRQEHKSHEREKLFVQRQVVLRNPGPLYVQDLTISIGGSEYPAYKTTAEPLEVENCDLNIVRFNIFVEQAAVTTLMDLCIRLDPAAFFSTSILRALLAGNLSIAARVSHALLYTTTGQSARKRLGLRENSNLSQNLQSETSRSHGEKLKHVSIRRALLLMWMAEPELFMSRRATAKDYVRIFEEHNFDDVPHFNRMNQIIAEFMPKKRNVFGKKDEALQSYLGTKSRNRS